MINVAIVDDDKSYVDQLREYFEQYIKESGEMIKITAFSDGDSIVHKYRSQFDIILMDIEMKFMDGMSAAEEIRKMDSSVIIIFITNTPQYAIKGYAVQALDYLLKPLSYFAFSQCVGRAINNTKNRLSTFISINVKGGVVRLDTNDIYYIESRGHNVVYHTKSGNYELRSTMKEIEGMLNNKRFFRASKWYLINLAHVDSFRDTDVILAGHSLAVSRSRKNELLEALSDYWGEVMQ